MMHQLLIDQQYCRGLDLCHECEAIHPGLVKHCETKGRLLISGPATAVNGATIAALIACCPDRAITINTLD